MISKKGISLIDVLIGITLASIAFWGIMGAYQLSLQVSNESKFRTNATAIANKRLEEIKNLSYHEIGTINGYPVGDISETEDITINIEYATSTYTIETEIIYGINCKDGVGTEAGLSCPENAYGECPNGVCEIDDCPNDYKMIYTRVFWEGRFPGEVNLQTIISPITKEQECQEKGGFISVEVFDSFGANISNPTIAVKNLDTNQEWSAVPNLGLYTFVVPEGSDVYRVSVTKDNYSSERTYAIGETYNGEIIVSPNSPDLSAFQGQTTEVSLLIDRLSNILVYTKTVDVDDIYYVKKNGNDSNSGLSVSAPFLTISKAVSIATANDFIFVAPGIYTENVEFANSGTVNNYINLIADTDGIYTGDSGDVLINATGTKTIIIDNKDYISIYGFKISNASDFGVYINNAENISIINNNILSNSGTGIGAYSSDEIIIQDNDLVSNGYGIYLENNASSSVINNKVHQNSNYGIYTTSSPIYLGYNEIYSNLSYGAQIQGGDNSEIYFNEIYSNSTYGLKVSDQLNGSVNDNEIYSNTNQGILLDDSYNVDIFNNLVYLNQGEGIKLMNSSRECTLYNNTLYDNSDGIYINTYSSDSDIKNNIIADNDNYGIYIDTTSTIADYNNIYSNTINYFGINSGTSSISFDPKFVDTSANNFLLQADSLCFDIGSATAIGLGISSNYTAKHDQTDDISTVDLGFHLFTGDSISLISMTDPFGSIISNVNFDIKGAKVIGIDSDDNNIIKISTSSVTGASGYVNLNNYESDLYTFSDFSKAGILDLYISSPEQIPINIAPGVTTTVNLGFKTQDSLSVSVLNASTTDPVFGAHIRVYNASIDQSEIADATGNAEFIPLPADTYTLEVYLQNYTTSTQSVSISGHIDKTVNLSEE